MRHGCGLPSRLRALRALPTRDAVLYRLDTPALADALAGRAAKDDALATINTELTADREQLHELSAAYGDRLITMREWLDDRQIQALLRRRDLMKKKIDALVAKRGETVFF